MEEKEIPIKEKEDGSVIAALDMEKDPFEDEKEDKKVEKASSEDHDDEDDDEDDENHAEGGQIDEGETDEEREKIREARREERKLKKELKRQREITSKNKINALERRNEELMRRLAAVESSAASFQFAQVDKAIEDEATRVEFAKMKMMQAAQSGNAQEQVDYLEQLTEAKQDRKSTRLNSSHTDISRMPSSA